MIHLQTHHFINQTNKMIQPTKNTYDFIKTDHERTMISTAIASITILELWDYMRNFKGESFMFSDDVEIMQIYNKIADLGYDGHSGCSFAFVMRTMQYIAIHGFEKYKTDYLQQ